MTQLERDIERALVGMVKSHGERLFGDCVFELPLRFMVKNGYLTPPRLVDAVRHLGLHRPRRDRERRSRRQRP